MQNKIKIILARFISHILQLFYKIRFPNLKLKNNGVFISKVNLIGSADIHITPNSVVKSTFNIVGKNNKLFFEDDALVINCIFNIKGDNCSLVFKGSRRMSDSRFDLLDSQTNLAVGRNTGFNKTRVVIAGDDNFITIGDDCIIAEDVEIWASDTHSIIDSTSKIVLNKNQPIIIGNHVWLATRSFITKGIHIRDNSIVGAGTIVTKDINSNTLVAGIPSKVLRTNVSWDIKKPK